MEMTEKSNGLTLKTFLSFAALSVAKNGRASVVSETARLVGHCCVLLFSMLPRSQTGFDVALTQDRADLLDCKWHTGIHPYIKNASHALKLTKLLEVIVKENHQKKDDPGHK